MQTLRLQHIRHVWPAPDGHVYNILSMLLAICYCFDDRQHSFFAHEVWVRQHLVRLFHSCSAKCCQSSGFQASCDQHVVDVLEICLHQSVIVALALLFAQAAPRNSEPDRLVMMLLAGCCHLSRNKPIGSWAPSKPPSLEHQQNMAQTCYWLDSAGAGIGSQGWSHSFQ